MRILIDLQGAQSGSRSRGIGRYSLALAKAIVRNAREHEVLILLNGLFAESIKDVQTIFHDTFGTDRCLIFTAPGPVAALTGENAWRRRTAEILREYFINLIAPDAVLITSMVEGAKDDAVTSLGILKSKVPTAAVLFDLIPLGNPDQYLTGEAESIWYQEKIRWLCRADILFAISQSTADEAIRLLHIDPSRVENISSAADDIFLSTNISSGTASVAKRFGIQHPYLMHSSAFEPRKNFEGLIRAYAALPKTVRANHQLVLVCELDMADRRELGSLMLSLSLALDEVVLPGFVTDEDLVELYRSCELFVFPSFHEGFGLPALEAMSCGTPTIGSNATSVPEVIGRVDALFNPASIPDMSALIHKALTDADFYQSLKVHAKVQAAKFSWDKTALRVINTLEKSVARPYSPPQSVENNAARREAMLEAVAEVARCIPPSDFEILELARGIEANYDELTRSTISCAPGRDRMTASSPLIYPEPNLETITSQVCTSRQFTEATYDRLCLEIAQDKLRHRKQWEYIYILRALEQLCVLLPGSSGLGFGCGKEPLAAVMAKRGVDVLCTDVAPIQSGDAYWGATNVRDYFYEGICSWTQFEKHVRFRPVNMTSIPGDLGIYDFLWSSCALEHLGSLQHGIDFVLAANKYLRCGGIAVHTTELNAEGDEDTYESTELSLYRKKDILRMKELVERQGNTFLPLNFNMGSEELDQYVDVPPYSRDKHLKIRIAEKYVTTSIGFVILKRD